MLIRGVSRAVGDIFYQRCFYLFLMLIARLAGVYPPGARAGDGAGTGGRQA